MGGLYTSSNLTFFIRNIQTDIFPILQGLNEVNIPFALILDHGYACLKSHVLSMLMILKNASKFGILYLCFYCRFLEVML